MGNQQNSIVLNGKIYDAVTGALIHDSATHHKAPKPKVRKNSGLVMDSVVQNSSSHHVQSHKPKVEPKPHHAPAKAHHPQRQHEHTPVAAHRHKPQRAATLMRHAVTKPAHHSPQHAKQVSAHEERTVQRLARAQAASKSQHIQRFSSHHAVHRSVSKKHDHLKVEAAPKPVQHTEHHRPAPEPLSQSEQLVSHALKNARAHEANRPHARKPKRRLTHILSSRRRSTNLAMGAIAVLILGGFFVYQNIPNFSMRLASSRAGFSAQLPDYKPPGFSQEKLVTYSPGKVTISFRSNSDERRYQLTQQVSNWNSQALADNYLAANKKPYQSVETGGKTIYVYDGINATWVNGGIWYQIEGQANLSSDQLLKIVNSI